MGASNSLQIVVSEIDDSMGMEIQRALEDAGIPVSAKQYGTLLESLDAPETLFEWTFTIGKTLWNPAIVGALATAVVKIYKIRRTSDVPLVFRDGDLSITAKNADEAVKFLKALKQSPLQPRSGPEKP